MIHLMLPFLNRSLNVLVEVSTKIDCETEWIFYYSTLISSERYLMAFEDLARQTTILLSNYYVPMILFVVRSVPMNIISEHIG